MSFAQATTHRAVANRPAEAGGFNGLVESSSRSLDHPASEKALQMLGANYKWGGTSEKNGMDCSGFVLRSYQDALGIALPRTAADMAQRLRTVMPHELRAGDLVFFNTSGRRFSHVGIYLGGSMFAHAPKAGQQARIDNLEDSYWLSTFDGARRPDAGSDTQALSKAMGKLREKTLAPGQALGAAGAAKLKAPEPSLALARMALPSLPPLPEPLAKQAAQEGFAQRASRSRKQRRLDKSSQVALAYDGSLYGHADYQGMAPSLPGRRP